MSFAGFSNIETKFAKSVANFGLVLPGVLLCVVLALAGKGLRLVPGLDLLGPMALAMALGMGIRAAMPLPAGVMPGVRLSAVTLLRAAVVLLGDHFHQAEAQSGAIDLLHTRIFGPVKGSEQAAAFGGRNADPAVCHQDFIVSVALSDCDTHPSLGQGVFERIFNKVVQRLPDQAFIAPHQACP